MRPADRAKLARQAALDRIERQQQDGLLVIRQMTPEERERYGPPQNKAVKKRRNLRISHERDIRKDA